MTSPPQSASESSVSTSRGEAAIQRALAWFETASPARGAFVVSACFAVIYLATAAYGQPQNVDTYSAALPAWKVAEHGTLRVDEFLGTSDWFVQTPTGVFSNRFPGVIFVAVPAYFVTTLLGLSTSAAPTFVPAGVTAALVTAAAMGVLFVVFTRVVDHRTAAVAVLVAGLGTSTWSVSAHALWTHGPAQLYLTLAVLSIASRRYLATGGAFALAVFTRPHLAMVPLVMGTWEAVRRRSLVPVAAIGALSTLGMSCLILYNDAVFGSPSVTGAYSTPALTTFTTMTGAAYIKNWVLTFFSPLRGILLYSPFLLASVPHLPKAWRAAPDWVRMSAIGGVLYMALQLRINIYTGGAAFLGYRLPIEMLTLLAPLLLLSIRSWVAEQQWRRAAFGISVGVAIALQAYGVTVYLPIVLRMVG